MVDVKWDHAAAATVVSQLRAAGQATGNASPRVGAVAGGVGPDVAALLGEVGPRWQAELRNRALALGQTADAMAAQDAAHSDLDATLAGGLPG